MSVTVSPVLVAVAAMVSRMTWWLSSFLSLQFLFIFHFSLFSIFFLFFFPFFYFHLFISFPVSSSISSIPSFHARFR